MTHASQTSILITGCSSGIGLDAALSLHKKGYRVFATARQANDVEQLQSQGLWACQLDVTSESSIEQALQKVLHETGGTLDVLFNNGAYGQAGAVEDLSLTALREQFETNVFGWHALTVNVLKVMRQQGHGKIIQNSSVLGFVCMPFRGAYNASKYALEALTDTLRLELMDTDIHFSLIEPGPIQSKFRENALKKLKEHVDIEASVFREQYQIQLERLGKDIANQFTLPASAVTKRVEAIINSRKPKARYYVTTPTYVFGFLKRVLPTSWLDRLLVKG